MDGIWLSPITPSPDGTGATTSRTTATSIRSSATWRPSTVWSRTRRREASGCSSTSCRTTPATTTRGSSTPGRRGTPSIATGTCGPTHGPTARRPTTGSRSSAGGPGSSTSATGQYYLHNFLVEQPDLNWWNEDVRREFEEILRFWFDRGIAGFRIDVANGLIKDRELRDNPPATDDDPEDVRRRGQRQVHNMNRPEVHEIYRDWRGIADASDPPRVLVGETWIFDLAEVARFYGRPATSSTCASTSRSSSPTWTPRPCAGSWRRPRTRSSRSPSRRGPARTTTSGGSRRGGAPTVPTPLGARS